MEWEVPWLAGYRRRAAGAHRQCRERAVAARRVRRADGCAVSGDAPRSGAAERKLGHPTATDRPSGEDLGPSRTRASGKCAAAHGTSPFPRRWPGSRWTARSAAPRSSTCRHRWTSGARCGSGSTIRSAATASTRRRSSFVQYYGGDALDASLLLLPLVGFLPPDDPRIKGTVAAIQRELTSMVWCCAIARTRASMGCRPAKACSSRAASGWPTTWSCRAGTRGACAVRAAAGAVQRCRPAGRGIRSRAEASARAISRRRSRIWR